MSTTDLQCSHCSKSYQSYMTAHGKPSKLCPSCRENQKKADEKRKDRVRNYQAEGKRNLEGQWTLFLKKSVERKLEAGLQKDEFLQMIQSPCFYCKYTNADEVNGIDRIDNSKGYIKENCVSACKICNRIKHIFHPLFFVEKAKIITAFSDSTLTDSERDLFYSKWKEYVHKSPVPYGYMKRQTEEKREIPFNLTKEQYEEIIYKPCYLCGFKCTVGNGLDRADNTRREYSYDNVKPCCSSCNMMKAFFTKEEFLKKIKEIATHCTSYPESWSSIPRNGFHMGGAKTEKEQKETIKQWRAKTIYKAVRSDTLSPFIERTLTDTEWTRDFLGSITKSLFQKVMTESFENVEDDLKELVKKINFARNH